MAFNKAKALQEAEKYVTQGKLSQAIKQYRHILDKDPSDLTLLNTVGDLCVRNKELPEALKHFYKLAESYSHEGFTVKAIAIYKKISKLDSSAVDILVKMGELYTLQGLSREAREQFAQAVEAYRKKNQSDKALDAFKKIVALDPENAGYRAKLADFCAQAGKKSDAAKAYAEAAELFYRNGDEAGAESSLNKALSLDDKNPQVQLLRARVAIGKGQAEEAEKILNSLPDLQSSPAAQQVLLDSYLGTGKLDKAESLIVSVFRSNPANFAPVASYADLCLQKGDTEAALKPLIQLIDTLLEMKQGPQLMEVLRKIWQKTPDNIPLLEQIYKVADKSADEATIPEVLEALGGAYHSQENLENSEWAYRELVKREPQNANYKGLLKTVLQKQGKEMEHEPAEFAEVALAPEGTAAEAAPAGAPSEDEARKVKEALDNSDLFSQYGLAEKAVAELEKALATYPDQVDIHRRILEVCQKSLPDRSKKAAEELARIYAARGDAATAEKYTQTATTGAPPPVFESSLPAVSEAAPAEAPAAKEETVAEFDMSAGLPGAAEEAPAEAASSEPAAPAVQEFDLSASFAAGAEPSEAPEAPPPPLPGAEPVSAPPAASTGAFNIQESRTEIDFYLSQGFIDEAQKAVDGLKARFPESAEVASLQQMIDEKAPKMPVPGESVPEPVPQEIPAEEAGGAPAEIDVSAPPPTEPPVAAGPASPPEPPPSAPAATPEPAAASAAEPAPAPAAADPLGSLVGDLADSLGDLGGDETAAAPAPGQTTPAHPAAPPGVPSPLSGLLDELEEPAAATGGDDPQTHYDLGVAFREMSLLDEAIGEFQKVVKGAQKGKYPPNYLQACTLLATCFMDKQLPAIAAKWYSRALETPNLDDEAMMALEYDMGVAFEQAGDKKTALEKFSEVYSQNIDYRDVADKIRQLKS